MEVKKLKTYIEQFKNFLQQDRMYRELFKWRALSHFQKTWDIEAVDFAEMYDQSLQSDTTQRLWKRETWRPKEMMLLLIRQDVEFARRMFRTLFDEQQNIETRISMFKFGCESLLQDYKKDHPMSIINNHYHDDNEIIFLYLCFHYPQEYTFFDYPPFLETLKKMNIKDLPDPYNIDRFLKLTKIMDTFLRKEVAIIEAQQRRLPKDMYYAEVSKLLVHDFYRYASSTG